MLSRHFVSEFPTLYHHTLITTHHHHPENFSHQWIACFVRNYFNDLNPYCSYRLLQLWNMLLDTCVKDHAMQCRLACCVYCSMKAVQCMRYTPAAMHMCRIYAAMIWNRNQVLLAFFSFTYITCADHRIWYNADAMRVTQARSELPSFACVSYHVSCIAHTLHVVLEMCACHMRTLGRHACDENGLH